METMTRWEDLLNDGYDLHESCVKVKQNMKILINWKIFVLKLKIILFVL